MTVTHPARGEYPAHGLDFSLHVEHNETRWQYASRTLTSKSSILGVRFQENLAPRLRGSLQAGYLDLSQPDNPLPAARNTSGYFGGVDLTLLLLELQGLQLELSGGYSYQDTRGSADDINVEMFWHDTYAQLGLNVPLAERLELHAVGGTLRTSGEQRVSGATTRLLTFDEEQREYYAVGLNYRIDRTGSLDVTWLGGGREGFRFAFRRSF